MHHMLLKREGSHRRAVLWLYFQTLCFSIIALSFSQLEGYSAYLFLVAVIVLTARLLKNLGMLRFQQENDFPAGATNETTPGKEEKEN
jgi:hypothetical protein